MHLAEVANGRYLNPLRPDGLGRFEDRTRPTVKPLRAERHEAGVKPFRLSGTLDLVVESFDATPMAGPAPWTERPVTPAQIRWRVRGGAWQRAVASRQSSPSSWAYARA